jgi:hypothetical protein
MGQVLGYLVVGLVLLSVLAFGIDRYQKKRRGGLGLLIVGAILCLAFVKGLFAQG